MAMTLNSPAFQQNGHIPSKYTCEGEDVSPPLAWEGVPNGAKSLVLVIDDPDAPDPKAPKMVWVHWVAIHLPPFRHPYGGGIADGLSALLATRRNGRDGDLR
jgi:Raf kinase inhibitor-like YbhB/YbcL family protein